MSGKLRVYKEKLEGFKRFYSIVKTIKMVTLAKFRQVQARLKTRDYTLRYTERVFSEGPVDERSLAVDASSTLVYIPITTNRGSCGAINSNIYRYLETISGPKMALMPIGKKGQDSLSKLFPKAFQFSILNDMKNPPSFAYATYIWECAHTLGEATRYQVVFNRYISAGMQRQAVYNFNPYDKWREDMVAAASQECPRYLLANALLNLDDETLRDFYDFHASLAILNAVSENELSEQAARIVAVEGQLTNISTLQNKTLMLYNKTRQGSITAALIEILSAMSSLEGNQTKGVRRQAFW